MKDIAPPHELRKWFGHDPKRWEAFKQQYEEWLTSNEHLLDKILELEKKHGTVTLLYSAKDQIHNNAIVLQDVLNRRKEREN